MSSLQRHLDHVKPEEVQKLRNGIYAEKIQHYTIDEIEKELEILKQQIEDATTLQAAAS